MTAASFPWRQLGEILAAEGLLTEGELETALREQRRTGRLLGQILVESGYVSSFTLARALTAQHGVELEPTGSTASPADAPVEVTFANWKALGTLLVERGFVSDEQLESALFEQERRPERRLGEILVERGYLTGSALARALAQQHGVPLEKDLEVETHVRRSVPGEPVYRVHRIVLGPVSQAGPVLHETANFLEAADFAYEYVQSHQPDALEIQRVDALKRETVWSYSESRAEAEQAEQKGLIETFGFDPMRWNVT
jgi:hypothetical protein